MSATPSNRLFYLNTSIDNGLPHDGYVCVNSRDNAIPDVVIDTNKKAHDLIRAESAAHGIQNSVWQYYKLLNVQYRPIDKAHAGLFGSQSGEDDLTGASNPSTYYLANIVVETNRALQIFSGGLVGAIGGVGGTGSNSDYGTQFAFPGGTGDTTQRNMFSGGSAYNMGGCMGCHGGQGQLQGGDFSVIVKEQRVHIPELPAPPTVSGATVMERNRHLEFSIPASALLKQ